jgi:hypothetical protein
MNSVWIVVVYQLLAVVYVAAMLWRIVRALERIADKLEQK